MDSFLPEKLVMLDCEMTGVDETAHELLQAAFVKLELNNGRYEEVGDPLVLYFKHDGVPSNDFHKKYLTHIFEKCNESDLTGEQGNKLLEEWLGDWLGQVEPTGDCVHCDLAFLKHNGVVRRNNIVDEKPVPGTFHYEAFELNPLKAFARTVRGEKYAVADLDEEGVHDGLVDCRNQTKELNSYVEILLPQLTPVETYHIAEAGAFKELDIERMEAESVISPEEAHKIFRSQDSPPDKNLSRFQDYTWTHEQFPLDKVTVNGGEKISEPMWSEGFGKPQEPWNLEKFEEYESKRNDHDEDWEDRDAYLARWGDEYQARSYSQLSTKAPPVFLIWDEDENRYRYWNGRHRSRAAWLRGERTIDAYVGHPIAKQATALLASADAIQVEPLAQVRKEIKDKHLLVDGEYGSYVDQYWVKDASHSRTKPPEQIACLRDESGRLVGYAGVGLYERLGKKMPGWKGKARPEPWRGNLNVFVADEYRGKGVASKLALQALEDFKTKHPEVEDVFYHPAFAKGEDLIDQVGLFPVQWGAPRASASLKKEGAMRKRIKSAEEPVTDLPVEVQPMFHDDGRLPENTRSFVETFQRNALRADSFGDFQLLLDKIMLDAKLLEEFRPSVAGILNEYRVGQGYVAL